MTKRGTTLWAVATAAAWMAASIVCPAWGQATELIGRLILGDRSWWRAVPVLAIVKVAHEGAIWPGAPPTLPRRPGPEIDRPIILLKACIYVPTLMPRHGIQNDGTVRTSGRVLGGHSLRAQGG